MKSKDNRNRSIHEIITIYRKMKKGRVEKIHKLKNTHINETDKCIRIPIDTQTDIADNHSKEVTSPDYSSDYCDFGQLTNYNFTKYDDTVQKKFLFYSKESGIKQFDEINCFDSFYKEYKNQAQKESNMDQAFSISKPKSSFTRATDTEWESESTHRDSDYASDFEIHKGDRSPAIQHFHDRSEKSSERNDKFSATKLSESHSDRESCEKAVVLKEKTPANKNFWLNVFDPSTKDLSLLGQMFNIHSITLSDIRERDTREKIEEFHSYIFISIRLSSTEENEYYMKECTDFDEVTDEIISRKKTSKNNKNPKCNKCLKYNAILSDQNDKYGEKYSRKNFDLKCSCSNDRDDIDFNIILFSDKIITLYDCPWNSVFDILSFTDLISSYTTLFPEWVLFSILVELMQDLRFVVDKVGPFIQDIQQKISCGHGGKRGLVSETKKLMHKKNHHIEDSILLDFFSDHRVIGSILQENFLLTSHLDALRRTTKPKINILQSLIKNKRIKRNLRKKFEFIFSDFLLLEKDIREERKTLERCQDLLLGLTNMAQSTESIDLNRIMKTFTLITLVFLPLQAVSGLWGMNVKVPGQSTESLGWFWGLTLLGPVLSGIYFVWPKVNKLIFRNRKQI